MDMPRAHLRKGALRPHSYYYMLDSGVNETWLHF